MKTILKFSLTALLLILVASCSTSDDSTNEIETQLLGKWLFENPNNNPSVNNSFTFNPNGNVTYSYWTGSGNNYDTETGTFSFNGDIMTMDFPENVNLTYIQKVVFLGDNVVGFQPTGISGENAYEGDYFREGADNYAYNMDKLNLFLDTGNAWRTGCGGSYESSNKINIKVSYFSDGTEVDSKTISSGQGFQIHEDIELDGDIISVKVQLEDFNENALDKGVILYDTGVRIETLGETILVNELLGELFICTDSRYEVTLMYNKVEDKFTIEDKTYGF
ncbi:hypothetical protein PK35_04370 [Tamlana nanhaiensis]|uniref:Lipocalin-like domain-containing protein n=1 Tax=Neotamlana nanhaiensis TaxID=1382798 RepID=A0A0D7W841_9FLAO|nr:hypothetical protein [Tamlana nanhaiensis]KJD33977.1 hypothetical protein PK35_04370 [Tamlana nanhaiensis]